MSILDKLENYSSLPARRNSTIFDDTTPEGAFFKGVHNKGYKLYENLYIVKDFANMPESLRTKLGLDSEHACVVDSVYKSLSPDEQKYFEHTVEYTELYNVLKTTGNQCINAIAGAGKALTADTKIMTEKGLVPIGELKVGDKVFGEDGNSHNVTGVFPQGTKRVYAVVFTNGNVVTCCKDHLWTVIDAENNTFTETTENLLSRTDDTLSLPSVLPLCGEYYGQNESYNCFTEDFFELLGFFCISPSLASAVVLDTYSGYVKQLAKRLGYDYVPQDMGLAMLFETKESMFSLECAYQILDTLGHSHEVYNIPINLRKAYLKGRFYGGDMADLAYVTETYFREVQRIETNVASSLGYGVMTDIRGVDMDACSVVIYGAYETYYNALELNRNEPYTIDHIEKTSFEEEMVCISVDNPSSLYLIEGAIPTHNTTALVFKIIHDIVTGECMTVKRLQNGLSFKAVDKVWVCTFLRTGAAELKESLLQWQRELGYSETGEQVVFSTLDAEFQRCLTAMGVSVNIPKDPSVLRGMLHKAINACGVTNQGAPLTKEDYMIIESIVTYHRGRLDNKRYSHPSMKDYGIMPRDLDIIVSQFESLRRQAKVMDFDEVQELLYKYLYTSPNKDVQNFVAGRYKYIYIDEFQDTSQMQYAILKFYARGHLWMNCGGDGNIDVEDVGGLYTGEETQGKIVAIGDPSQCLTADMLVNDTSINPKPISSVKYGDMIRTYRHDTQKEGVTMALSDAIETKYSGKIYDITMADGKVLTVTPEEKLYKEIHDRAKRRDFYGTTVTMPSVETTYLAETVPHGHTLYRRYSPDAFKRIDYYANYDAMIIELLRLTKLDDVTFVMKTADHGGVYIETNAKDLKVGDKLLHTEPYDSYRRVYHREIVSITEREYKGAVYDINTKNHLFTIQGGYVVHNCIYSFKGSDSSILVKNFDEDFRPTLCRLSTNYRCPKNILDPIVPSIHKNKDSASQVIEAFNDGGEFNAYAFTSYKSMVDQLLKDIERDSNEGNSVAILCRTNFDGAIPAFVLEADRRFKFGLSKEGMTLDGALPRKLINVTSLFMERSTPAVKASLDMFVARTDKYEFNKLMDTLKTNSLWVWEVPLADLRYSVPSLVRIVEQVRGIIYPNGVRDKSREIDALKFIYFDLMANVFKSQSAYSLNAKAYISSLLYILDSRDYKTVYDYVEDLDIINTRLHGRIGKRNEPIQIATVHEFKGKERDSIIVWNDSEGSFPSSKCNVEDEDELAEERRVHYIACTRARKRNTIYTLQDRIGTFVKEMDISLKTPTNLSTSLGGNKV